MTGAVLSPEPYQQTSTVIHLLKTQVLAELFKAQTRVNALLGPMTIFPDVPLGTVGLSPYVFINCSIASVSPMAFDGTDAEWQVSIVGYYNINEAQWG
jgi:hypothetical protein